MAFEEKAAGARHTYYDCGVPMAECKAALVTHSGPKSLQFKAHSSYESAISCQKLYGRKLESEKAPDDPIYLFSKPVRLKPGKGGRAMLPGFRG